MMKIPRWVIFGALFCIAMLVLSVLLSGCASSGGLIARSTQEQKDEFDRKYPDLAPKSRK